MEDLEKIQRRLAKIKRLAEQGIGGEKETAIRMYHELVEKYGITEVEEIKLNMEWFRYKTELEQRLLSQILYMVTGSTMVYKQGGKSSHSKLIGIECTTFEKEEIEIYYEHYKKFLQEEFDIFMSAFCSKNSLYPDETARCYKEPDDKEETIEERQRRMRIAFMSEGMNENGRPVKRLEG